MTIAVDLGHKATKLSDVYSAVSIFYLICIVKCVFLFDVHNAVCF